MAGNDGFEVSFYNDDTGQWEVAYRDPPAKPLAVRKQSPKATQKRRFEAKRAERLRANEAATANIDKLGSGIASIPSRVVNYIKSSTPSSVGRDVKGIAKATYEAATEDPNAFIEDAVFSPLAAIRDFGDVRETARKLRAQGRDAEAEKMEAMAGTAILSAVPILGRPAGVATRKAIKAAEKTAIKGATKKAAEMAVTPKSKPPSLLSAVRVGGKTYTGPTHLDALAAIPDPKVRSQASLDANSRGFVNERGKYMDRFKAADYARNFDLFAPDAPDWAKTAPEVISENLRLPEIAVKAETPKVAPTKKKVAPFTATPPQVEPLPGKGGKSRRKSTPEQVVSQASTRVRQEARARNQVKDPAERRAIRETYTVGPLKIDPDPELERFKIEPGNAQSVTSQAAEQGFPVVGLKPFSAQHPAGYSTSYGADKPDPLNFTAEYRNRTPEPDLPELTEADFPIGSGLYRMLGDATMANKDVISVDGVRLRSPVSTYGGAGYGAQERAIGSPLVWASDAGFTENDARMIQDFYNANPGDPLFGLHVNMGPSGSDFSHQGSSVLAKMIPEMGYSGDTLRAIDDYIRSGAQGLPDFQGFAEDPDLGMFDLLTRTGADRKLVVKRLSDVNQKAQAAGVPKNLGALARLAVSEQGLRLAPQGSTGFSVAQIDPSNFFRVDPELLSKTKRDLFENTNEYANVLGEPVNMRVDYNSGLSGTVKGQMENLIPAEIPFNPVFERAKKFDKNNNPTTSTMKFKSFATDPNSIVKVTPEIQDAIGEYLYRTKRFKKLGFACGGPVKKRRFASK